MPEKKTLERARRAKREGKAPSTQAGAFVEFVALFRAEEGRMGVTVTFIAVLELLREGLIEIVQSEPYAPIHVRAGAPRPAFAGADTEQAGSGPQGNEP